MQKEQTFMRLHKEYTAQELKEEKLDLCAMTDDLSFNVVIILDMQIVQ